MSFFHSPYFLLLLPLVWFVWRWAKSKSSNRVSFSATDFVSTLPVSWKQRITWLPNALALCALIALTLAAARPREALEHSVVESEGIAIEMVVDRSSSMQALDFQIDGEHVNRLVAIKHVADKFVRGDEKQRSQASFLGRFNDLIGLIAFAGYADAVTPPTLDHEFLISQLAETQIVTTRQEDGTAIGDAISLAVEKLNRLDERQEAIVKSKIMILLTDGENTAGDIDPKVAAELAESMGIRIYTIGVGTRGQAPVPVQSPLSGRQVIRWMEVSIDEKLLQEIADVTNGKYFRATDLESLESIYAEIDELEKTTIESQVFVDYRELAISSWRYGWLKIPALVWLAIILTSSRIMLENTVLREFG